MAERSLELDSIELAAAIFGSGDQNIHLLEKEFRVTAVCRGSVLRFTGEQKMWTPPPARWRAWSR